MLGPLLVIERLGMILLRRKDIVRKVSGDEVTEFSTSVKEEASGPTLDISTNLGRRWMLHDLPVLSDKHYEQGVNIRLIFRAPNVEVLGLAKLFDAEIGFGRNTTLPPINITQDKVALYYENEEENLREAILLDNKMAAKYYQKVYEEDFRKSTAIPDAKLYPSLYEIMRNLDKKVADTLSSPEKATKTLELSFLTDAKKYRIPLALYFLQSKDNRSYSVKEISEVSKVPIKTIYRYIEQLRRDKSVGRNISVGLPYPYILRLTEKGLQNIPKLIMYWVLQQDLKQEGILPSRKLQTDSINSKR